MSTIIVITPPKRPKRAAVEPQADGTANIVQGDAILVTCTSVKEAKRYLRLIEPSHE